MQLSPFIHGSVYILFIAFWLAVFVIFYHLTRFGIGTMPKRVAMIFLIGSVALFCTSLILYINL